VNDLEQRILDAVAPLSGIETLVLFGSHATGRARPDSDLDVAVLPKVEVESRRKLQLDVIGALMDLAAEGRVDVVLVDEAPVVFRQRIMEHGRVLFGADSRAWQQLRFETMREYADTAYHRRLYREKQAERLLKGERSGRSGIALETLRRTRRLLGKA